MRRSCEQIPFTFVTNYYGCSRRLEWLESECFRNMLTLPTDIACGGILPHLSVCDLRALDTAFTNKCLRPQLQQVWKSYRYDALDATLQEGQVEWLYRVGVQIISLTIGKLASASESIIMTIKTMKRLCVKDTVNDSLLLQLVSNNPNLVELCVDKLCGSNVDEVVSALAQNCRQLHILDISSEELTDVGFIALAKNCHELHTLCISGELEAQVTDAGVQVLCDNCPHLKHVKICHFYDVTDASVMAIANSYPHLKSINLSVLADDILIYFADKCHELRSVQISCLSITSRGLTALWAANPNLMDVDIRFNDNITDIIKLAQCCPLLQTLNVCYCPSITDAAVIAVAEHCPQLKSLNISNRIDVSDASLIALGQHCHDLKSIKISYLENISDVGIAALAAGCPLLQEFYADNTNIIDAGVAALARGCRDLRKLNMSECYSIGVAAISAIAENCPLISELNLKFCNIDDACLHSIVQHCRNLNSLNIYGAKVSVASVQSAISACRMLEMICCAGCFMSEVDRMSMRKCQRGYMVIEV